MILSSAVSGHSAYRVIAVTDDSVAVGDSNGNVNLIAAYDSVSPVSDNILDSDCGNTINGGEIINIGSGRNDMSFGNRPMDFPEGERPGRPEGEFPGMPMGTPPQGEPPQQPERP